MRLKHPHIRNSADLQTPPSIFFLVKNHFFLKFHVDVLFFLGGGGGAEIA